MTVEFPALPEGLRQKYLSQLSTRRTELANFLAKFEAGNASPGDRDAARIHAHSLKGTGRTYGYPEISATGSALEDAMNNNAGQADLAGLTRALLAACDGALATTQTQPQSPLKSASDKEDIAYKPPAAPTNIKPTLLVVDDDPAILDAMKALLDEHARIFTAADGVDALTIIEREKPDLVVLDDKLPGVTGMELLEKWQAAAVPLPSQIIMLTANAAPPSIIRGLSAGAIDYITKPFEPAKLVARIRGLLRCLRTTILVADDDMAVRGMLQHKFRTLGFRMMHATDGEQAIKLAREAKPQLAILDRMMPGLDGLAVLQMMRDEDALRDIPVILLTAKRQNSDVVEGFHLGATDYITKPFMPDEVVARAMRLLGISRTG